MQCWNSLHNRWNNDTNHCKELSNNYPLMFPPDDEIQKPDISSAEVKIAPGRCQKLTRRIFRGWWKKEETPGLTNYCNRKCELSVPGRCDHSLCARIPACKTLWCYGFKELWQTATAAEEARIVVQTPPRCKPWTIVTSQFFLRLLQVTSDSRLNLHRWIVVQIFPMLVLFLVYSCYKRMGDSSFTIKFWILLAETNIILLHS